MSNDLILSARLARPHLLFLVALSALLTIVVFWLALYNEQLALQGPAFVNRKGFVAAALALAGSVLAATYVTLGLCFYDALLRRTWKSQFRAFFGLDQPDHGTIIVLPRFEVRDTESHEHSRGINGISVKRLKELDRRCVSMDDLVAVRHINALFAEAGVVPPKIFFDDDVWRVIYSETPAHDSRLANIHRSKNLIVIGLFSNCITTTVNKRNERTDFRSFQLSSLEDAEAGLRQLDIAPMDKSVEDWRRTRDGWVSECRENQFALLARVKAPGERTALIIGGSTARGTRKLASYLQEYWLRVFEFQDTDSKRKIGTGPFSMQFSVPNEKNRKPQAGFTFY